MKLSKQENDDMPCGNHQSRFRFLAGPDCRGEERSQAVRAFGAPVREIEWRERQSSSCGFGQGSEFL